MTKFMKLKPMEVSTDKKETRFAYVVVPKERTLSIQATLFTPSDFDNVLWIGHNHWYGDVFKVWSDVDPIKFNIFFGTKGDEFNYTKTI